MDKKIKSQENKLNNLSVKIDKTVSKGKSEKGGHLNWNIKPDNGNEASINKEVLKPSDDVKRPRRSLRNQNIKPLKPPEPCSSDRNKASESPIKSSFGNEFCKDESKGTAVSLGLVKVNYDINIDTKKEDRHTDKPMVAPDGVVPSLSPETVRKRFKGENLVVARQCRLHPANKMYNQGPVENPPLISPGVVIDYTPAGQRHEVDLNFERPTWFNSEYARMQFDDATRINTSRMFHDLRSGIFLPSNLDPDIERRYFAEQELVTEDAKKYFEALTERDFSGELSDDDECLSLLEIEGQLIELNEFANVKFFDFPEQLSRRLTDALSLKLTPMMFKKNPIIVETLEKISKQCYYREVVKQASALLTKIKSLFDVPNSQTFHEYFASEVQSLKEKTKNMSGFDILMMTQEPLNEPQDETVQKEIKSDPEEEGSQRTNTTRDSSGLLCEDHSDDSDWIIVEDDDSFEDIDETVSSYDGYESDEGDESNDGLELSTDSSEDEGDLADSEEEGEVVTNLLLDAVINEE